MLASSRPIHHIPDVSHAERESKYKLFVLFAFVMAFVDVALIIFSEARNIFEGSTGAEKCPWRFWWAFFL